MAAFQERQIDQIAKRLICLGVVTLTAVDISSGFVRWQNITAFRSAILKHDIFSSAKAADTEQWRAANLNKSLSKRYLATPLLCLLSTALCIVVSAGRLQAEPATAEDYRQACYFIERQKICLTDGHSAVDAAPGSATKIETFLFGHPAYGDLDGDGVEDTVVLLIHRPGGSGTFYYVAAALRQGGRVQGTNAVLLGDRITPQTIAVQNGVVTAKYADRRSDESMATSPSIGKSKYLAIKEGKLEELKSTGP